MSFELPTTFSTSSVLLDLEQNAPNVTPKAIRSALVTAAQTIDEYEKRSADVVRILEEALGLRVSQMDSQSRVQEIERAVKNAMIQSVARLKG